MTTRIPVATAILGYHDLFQGQFIDDRLGLINGMCKTQLIAEISGLNYRLKPKDKKYFDKSFDTQDRELTYFCGENKPLFDRYAPLVQAHIQGNRYPLIFTRQTCLFALEEIIGSDIAVIEDFTMKDSWENLLKYLLCVNSELVSPEPPQNVGVRNDAQVPGHQEPAETEASIDLEQINAKLIVLNELNIDTDQFYLPFRSYHFLNFLTNHPDIGIIAVAYIHQAYGMDFRQYIYEIMSLYHANNHDKKNNVKSSVLGLEIDTTFIYYPQEHTEWLFETLSQRFANRTPEKLLSIRKYPFYNALGSFILSDNTIIQDKLYGQFINDFWFDAVKDYTDAAGRKSFDIKRYRGIIGQFFEEYLNSIISFFTKDAPHFKVRCFNELITDLNGEAYELSDVYIRHNNKVFLAEAKSTGIYDKEKYSGELNEFYGKGRDEFFDSFGMKQIVKAVENLRNVADQFDGGLCKQGRLKVFPAVIVNEKAMQTPLMAHIFNKRFKELVAVKAFDRLSVQPLILLHISDFENMEERLRIEPTLLWRILEYHVKNSGFMPPFFNTLNRLNVHPLYDKPMSVYKEIIEQYQAPGAADKT